MSDTAVIRTWLRENGYNPGQRGRLHPDHLKAYRVATQAPLLVPEKLAEPTTPVPAAVPTTKPKQKINYACGWCCTGDHAQCREVLAGTICNCFAKGHKD